jgi:hypothetical protein
MLLNDDVIFIKSFGFNSPGSKLRPLISKSLNRFGVVLNGTRKKKLREIKQKKMLF